MSFETEKYRIRYDANGGSGEPGSQEKNHGEDITLSTVAPNRIGYTFKGWSEDRNANVPTWLGGGIYTNNESKTLYAVWRDETKPTMISLTPNTTAWTNGNVTLTAKAQDMGTGIVGYAWTDTATAPTNWQEITATTGEFLKETTLMANGTRYIWVKDGAGNINNAGITVSNIDKTAPGVATIQLSSTYVTGGITARVTHTDGESGVKIGSSKYVFNTTAGAIGTNAVSYNGTFSSNGQTISLTPSGSGIWYLHVLTVDNAGNARETISAGADLHVHSSACLSTACRGSFAYVSQDSEYATTCAHYHAASGGLVAGAYYTQSYGCYRTPVACWGSCYSRTDSDLQWSYDVANYYCVVGQDGMGATWINCKWKGTVKGTTHVYNFTKYCNTCGQSRVVSGSRTYCSRDHALADAQNYPHGCNKTLYGLSCGIAHGGQLAHYRTRQLYRCNGCGAAVYYYPYYSEGSACSYCGGVHSYGAAGATSTTHNAVSQYCTMRKITFIEMDLKKFISFLMSS